MRGQNRSRSFVAVDLDDVDGMKQLLVILPGLIEAAAIKMRGKEVTTKRSPSANLEKGADLLPQSEFTIEGILEELARRGIKTVVKPQRPVSVESPPAANAVKQAAINDDFVRCPVCSSQVKARNLGRHTRRIHSGAKRPKSKRGKRPKRGEAGYESYSQSVVSAPTFPWEYQKRAGKPNTPFWNRT